jgi:hypothetical protein
MLRWLGCAAIPSSTDHRTSVGDDQVHGDVVGFGRQFVNEAFTETHTDALHTGSQAGQEPVIPAAALAESMAGCCERDPGHDDQVDRYGVRFIFGHDDREAEASAVIDKAVEVDFTVDGVIDHDGAGRWHVGFEETTDGVRPVGLVVDLTSESPVVGAHSGLRASHGANPTAARVCA